MTRSPRPSRLLVAVVAMAALMAAAGCSSTSSSKSTGSGATTTTTRADTTTTAAATKGGTTISAPGPAATKPAANETLSATFCSGRAAMQTLSDRLAAVTALDDKKPVLKATADEVQKLADAAPPSVAAAARVVAKGFRDYSDAISAIDSNDPNADSEQADAVQNFQTFLARPELQQFDDALDRCK